MLPLERHRARTPDPTETSCEGDHQFVSRDEGPYGQYEVLWLDTLEDGTPCPSGAAWYWIDFADPYEIHGPFMTSTEAFQDAQEDCQ